MKRVLAGGVFNMVHQGHVLFLKRARELGDFLIVVVANDKTVMKGKTLLKPQEERRRGVEKLKIADRVVIGDEGDFLRVVKEEKPAIIALGYDQDFDEGRLESLGCRVVRIPKFGSYRTREILGKK